MSNRGIILAGGKSSRMGTNKALLPIAGKTVVEWIIQEMDNLCSSVLIVARDENIYRFTGRLVVLDIYEDAGPLAGIHAAFHAGEAEWSVVCSCDHPFASEALFQLLLNEAEMAGSEVDAIIPLEHGRPQPLMAVYRHTAATALDAALSLGQRRVMDWVNQLNVRYLSLDEALSDTDIDPERVLFNMNYPEDYEIAQHMFLHPNDPAGGNKN